MAILSTMTRPAYAQSRSMGSNLLKVGDSTVKRIMPVPESDSTYADADYTEVHFRQNKADLDLDYMDNGKSLQHLHRVFDSLGIENVAAVEIIAQSSPDGGLARNEWLTEHRSQVILEYMNLHFPELSDRISLNTVTESWENLSMYVAQDPNLTEKNRTKILDIIDSPTMSVATKKSRLKNNLGSQSKLGNIYSYLLKYYYPVIRNTGIYVLHTVEPVTAFNMPPLVPYVEETSPVLPDTIGPAPAQSEPHVFEEPDSTPPERKRPVLAVKTNLPYYGFFRKDLGWAPIYNVEAEWYPTENGRWTLLGEYEFPWHMAKDNHECFEILNLQLEARRYFKKASNHSGHYLSAYAGVNLFDICFDGYSGHGFQGEGFGGGLGYGYVLPLGKKPDTRWKLEFFIKGGVYVTLYDPYDAGNPFQGKYYYEWYDAPNLFIRRNMIFRWLGPTGAGITLSYDLIRKKVKNK
ncbi:MAG: DUF3575 domain-containing protein [Bacteroidaceae bacterium]|nr:DUF3575 domain-containing protein [Bacteroidaceae bacterium]